MEKFDVVVIGGGPGGYPAAIRAAQLGASVALVEQEKLGGTCLNWGCIPTKLLISGTELYSAIGRAAEFGLRTGDAGFDYAAMIARKDAVVGRLRDGIGQLLKANGVAILRGCGSFVSREIVAVRSAEGERLVAAGRVIVASGSKPARPRFLPTDARIMDSRAFLALTELPRRLLVIGGGVIGCEFACMAARLGVEVTVVELLEDILGTVDVDIRRELKRHMEKQLRIRLLTGKPLERVDCAASGLSATVGGAVVECDAVLVAVGRLPNTDGLDLARAGLRPLPSGHLAVDDHGRTKAATVFAVGDVTAGPQLAHRATSQGLVAAEHACRSSTARMETVIPLCTFTDPEVAGVGLTEQEALKAGLAFTVGKFPFLALGKAQALGHTEGFVKVLAEKDTDRLIGAHVVGLHATDLIAEAAIAIRAELTASEFGRTVRAHPTLAESWGEAAEAVHGMAIHTVARRKKP